MSKIMLYKRAKSDGPTYYRSRDIWDRIFTISAIW